MLNHKKMKVSLVGHQEQLNRTFLVEENIDLNTFACLVLSSFGIEFAHSWQIIIDHRCFLPTDRLINGYGEAAIDYSLVDFSITKSKGIKIIYDNEQDYQFSIKLLKNEVSFPLLVPFVILEANGDTIFEDDHAGFDYFLENGKIKDGIVPWNLEEDNYGLEDFNAPIDIQLINDYVLRSVAEMVNGIEDEEDKEEKDNDLNFFSSNNSYS